MSDLTDTEILEGAFINIKSAKRRVFEPAIVLLLDTAQEQIKTVIKNLDPEFFELAFPASD